MRWNFNYSLFLDSNYLKIIKKIRFNNEDGIFVDWFLVSKCFNITNTFHFQNKVNIWDMIKPSFQSKKNIANFWCTWFIGTTWPHAGLWSSGFVIYPNWNETNNGIDLVKLPSPIEEIYATRIVKIATGWKSYAGQKGRLLCTIYWTCYNSIHEWKYDSYKNTIIKIFSLCKNM